MKKELWFKAKTFGYGWYPSTWQGWLVTIVYLILFTLSAITFSITSNQNKVNFLIPYITTILILTITLIIIAKVKGEKARWRWG